MDIDTNESFVNAQDFDVVVVQMEQMEETIENATATTSQQVPKKRGRKPQNKTNEDIKSKSDKNRQIAKECRMRKALRYQYLEKLVDERERAIFALRSELDEYRKLCIEVSAGRIPHGLLEEIGEE